MHDFIRVDPLGFDFEADQRLNAEVVELVPPALLLRLTRDGHETFLFRLADLVQDTEVANVTESRRAGSRLDTADLRRRAQELARHLIYREPRLFP